MNVPATVGMLLSHCPQHAEWLMMKRTMSLRTLHDLLEVAIVDAHNARVLARAAEAKAREHRDS